MRRLARASTKKGFKSRALRIAGSKLVSTRFNDVARRSWFAIKVKRRAISRPLRAVCDHSLKK
jgi:hypothetical protein